jgi:dihydrodipicolinate synthase/N-acetylneuraminate lyase
MTMISPELLSRIRGIVPAVPTPFADDGELDIPALRRIVRFLLEGGVHGLWVLGTGGEFTALEDEQKRRVITTVVQEAAGRVPVLVGTGQGGTKLATRAAVLAAECGADVLFAIPPYYYFYEDREVLAHIKEIRDATSLPVILYNNPLNTKIALPISTVQTLCREEGVVGIKDSSPNFDYFQTLLRIVPRDGSFKVLQGNEMSLAAGLLLGADGAVLALPTLAPRVCVQLYDCACTGDIHKARALQAIAADLLNVFSLPGRTGDSAFLAGQKAALEILGLCSRNVSAPFRRFTDDEMEPVRQILERHNLLSPSTVGNE